MANQPQPGQPPASAPPLEQALKQHAHAQAHGLNLSGVNWSAVAAALLQLIQALTSGQSGAPAQAGQPRP